MSAVDDALWALTVMEAHEAADAEGIAALLVDVPVEVVAARMAGMSVGLLIQLCLITGVSPGVWAAEKRAELTGMDAA